MIEKEMKKGDSGYYMPEPFLINFPPKSQSKIDEKTMSKKHENNCKRQRKCNEKGAKERQKEPEGSHKGAKGCQKGAKDQENHQKSCLWSVRSFLFFVIKFFSLKL